MRSIERQRAFLDFTISSLARRKGRNLSLVAVYALVIFMLASVMFFGHALRTEATAVLEGAPDMLVQRMVAGRHAPVPVEWAEDIDAIRGVRKVEPRLWGYYFHGAALATYTVMAKADFAHGDRAMAMGDAVHRVWTEAAAPIDGIYHFRDAVGEPLELTLAELLPADADLFTADLILVSEPTFRRLFGVEQGRATDLAVTIRNPEEFQTVLEKVVLAHPDARPILRDEILRTYGSLFDWRTGYVLVLLAGAVLAFLIFAWDKATGLSAEERAEIGILKGLGWDTADVLAVKFWEGAVVSLSAFVLGVGAGYLHVFFGGAVLFEHALMGWSTLYPDLELSPSVNVFQLAALFFLTVVPYTVITIYPAWRAASADPDVMMR
jgi:hypothetical protein